MVHAQIRGKLTTTPEGKKWIYADNVGDFEIICYEKQAQNVIEHLQTGTEIQLDGVLEQTRMTDATGAIRSIVRFVGDVITPI